MVLISHFRAFAAPKLQKRSKVKHRAAERFHLSGQKCLMSLTSTQARQIFFYFFRLSHNTLCYIAFVLSSLCSVGFKRGFFWLCHSSLFLHLCLSFSEEAETVTADVTLKSRLSVSQSAWLKPSTGLFRFIREEPNDRGREENKPGLV